VKKANLSLGVCLVNTSANLKNCLLITSPGSGYAAISLLHSDNQSLLPGMALTISISVQACPGFSGNKKAAGAGSFFRLVCGQVCVFFTLAVYDCFGFWCCNHGVFDC